MPIYGCTLMWGIHEVPATSKACRDLQVSPAQLVSRKLCGCRGQTTSALVPVLAMGASFSQAAE